MPRAEMVISRVRQCLERHQGKLPPEAAEIAREYAGAVEDVNRRLERCVSLLRQGLRTEAVHEAEIAPPVLNEAAALDCPQWEMWRVLCAEHGLAGAPAVNRDAVVEVDEAFPREQQLERFLCAHRRLALGRAPLKARIKVLRKLSQTDPENRVWGDDLVVFETARHKQITMEAGTAAARHDLAILEALSVECREMWLESPPPVLKARVEQLLKDERVRQAREKLRELRTIIADALPLENVEQLQSNLQEWKRAREIAGESPDAWGDDGVATAADWLEQTLAKRQANDKYHRTIEAIELALDDRYPIDRLEPLWATLVKLERAIPRVLQHRYDARIREARLDSSRRFGLAATTVACGILLVSGAVGFLIYRAVEGRRQRQWLAQIETATTQKRWPEAQLLLGQLREQQPILWTQPEFQALQSRVDSSVQESDQQRVRFVAAIDLAERAGVETPAKDAIKEAEALAATEADKGRIQALRQRIREHELNSQRVREREFSAALSEIRQHFAELRRQVSSHGTGALPALDKLRRNLTILTSNPHVSAETLASAQALAASLNTLIATLEDQLKQQNALDQALAGIPPFYGDSVRLADAMRAFTEQFPEHPFAAEFTRAAMLNAAQTAVVAWHERVGKLIVNPSVTDAAAAQELLDQIDAFTKEHPGNAYSASLNAYRAYLQRAQRALDPSNAPNAASGPLNRLLSHPMLANAFVLTDKHGRRFYTLDQLEPKDWPPGSGYILVQYISTLDEAFAANKRAEESLPRSTFGDDLKPKPSPQMLFVKELAIHLIRRGAWETTHLGLLDVLRKAESLDPILRLIIAKELVRLARLYDGMDHDELAEWQQSVEAIDTESPWMNPLDTVADTVRVRALEAVAALPQTQQLAKRFSDRLSQWRYDLKPREAIGVLWVNSDGKRTVSPLAVRWPDGSIECMEAQGNQWQFVRIGEVASDAVKLEDIATRIPAGTIVYCVPADK